MKEKRMLPQAVLNTASLLRRFRELIAVPGLTTQDKIRKALALLCHDLEGDVASVYVLRGLGTLELLSLATSAFFQEQRPKTLPREGVMGDVIDHERPVICSDICSHPKFSGSWGEGNLVLHGFMGAPLMRSGKVLGLISLQTLESRPFTEGDIETLQTFAMIFSEMIAGDQELQTYLEEEGYATSQGKSFKGHILASGLAIGHAFLHHETLEVDRILSDDTPKEMQRLFEALRKVHEELENLQKQLETSHAPESAEIFETYRMFSQDRGWLAQIQRAIEQGLTAEASVSQAIQKIRERIKESKDPYFRDRLWDFEDLSRRLLRVLRECQQMPLAVKGGIVVFADHLGPADLLDYQRYGLKGVVLQEDMALAHVGVVARSLNIPVISGVRSVLSRVQWGDSVLLNGETGEIFINPSEDKTRAFEEKLNNNSKKTAQIVMLKHLPAATKDGVDVQLMINAGASSDIKGVYDTSVLGIGLYRTEIPFMMQKAFPDVISQEHLYRDVYKQVGRRPVIFRTLDVGGDKILPYQKRVLEENPALGWRALRVGLDRPAYLKEQIKALIRASEGRALHLMFPMVSHQDDFLRAKEIFLKEFEKEKKRSDGVPDTVVLGAMIEVPSMAWMIDSLLPHVDFISVGTNDLFQFFYAVDRSNPWVRDRYDTLSKPFLSLLKHILNRATAFNVPVSICGEMASSPLETLVLMVLGYRSFSLNTNALNDLKLMIRSLDLARTRLFVEEILERNPNRLRQEITAYSLDHHIPLMPYKT